MLPVHRHAKTATTWLALALAGLYLLNLHPLGARVLSSVRPTRLVTPWSTFHSSSNNTSAVTNDSLLSTAVSATPTQLVPIFFDSPATIPAAPLQPPKVAIIIIWEGKWKPYLANLFASYRANHGRGVELIFLMLKGHWNGNDHECMMDSTSFVDTNIKSVCMDIKDYWVYHRDYFCKEWGCDEDQKKLVLKVFTERQEHDIYKSHYRIYRGYIFAHLMSPGVEYWGWGDPDVFVGNYQEQFPWDAMDYDVLVPGSRRDNKLYMRGHLCFFRTGLNTERKMLQYPNLRSIDNLIGDHDPTYLTEEAEFSAFIFRDPKISFLILPDALADVPGHKRTNTTAKLCTLSGVYFTEPEQIDLHGTPVTGFPSYPILDMPSIPEKRWAPTFSDEGKTDAIEINRNEDGAVNAWFPDEYVTHFTHEWNDAPQDWRVFVGRGGGLKGGADGVWIRLEPPTKPVVVSPVHDPSLKVILRESLYVHFFDEKRSTSWFEGILDTPLKQDQTFVSFFAQGAEIWNHADNTVPWRQFVNETERTADPCLGIPMC